MEDEPKKRKQDYGYINDFNRKNYDRYGVILPKGQLPKVKELAKARGVSVNSLVVTALREYLERNGVDLG